MKGLFLVLLLASVACLQAQVQLPDVDIFRYQETQRDPFISAEAPTTFLNQGANVAGVASGELIHRFLEKLTVSIKDQLFVGGISTDDQPQDGMAIINGATFKVGDTIPLEVDKETLNALEQLSLTFGLTLARTKNTNAIKIEVGKITTTGVDLVLPGFRSSICQLPLERDDVVTGVKLERKAKEHRP
jgi:hypothetical protein